MNRSTSATGRDHGRRRLRLAASHFLGAGAAALLLAGFAIERGDSMADKPPAGQPLPRAAVAPAPRATAPRDLVHVVDTEAAPPRRIRIPAIGVSAGVVRLRRRADGTMQTPEDFDAAGWYEPASEPGERGPSVIVGHVDSSTGPAVFYRLGELTRGDVIRVDRADGSAVRFRVEGLERWPKDAFPTRRVFGETRLATLRLVTCSGDFDSSTGHYADNTIVYATRTRVRRFS